jgi:hypothetical protein
MRVTCLPAILHCMSEVTRILGAIEQGDPHAAAELLPLRYCSNEPHHRGWLGQ